MATPAAILNILVDVNSGAATAQLTQLNSQMKATAVTANTTSTAIGTKLTRAAKIGGVALAGGLAYGLYKAVDAGVSFEKQMDSVGAVADASAKQMNRLREQALKLGQDTAYSASQVAEAQGELVKGGIKVKDVIGGALPAALSLAAAGEIDLASAAETTANAMQLFGLQGKQASHVSDLLATAANKTTADVEDFAMALKQGGAVAKLAGYDIDQTVTTLEALAAAGIKNSDAGTSMKTAFIQLLKPTEKQAALSKQLGLSFISQNGEMKDAAAISKQLRAATDGMTKSERARTFATLAGTDGVRTLSALYDAGPAALRKYAEANKEVGTAQDIAAEKMDNTAGSIEQLKGSLETLGIRIFDVIGPTFRDAVDLAAKGVEALNNVDLGEFFDDPAFKSAAEAIENIGKVILWVAEKVGPGLIQMFSGLARGVKGAVEIISGVLTGDFERVWQGVKDIFGGGVDYLIGTLKLLASPVKAAAEIIDKVFTGVWSAVKGAFRKGADFILGTLTTIIDGIAKLADVGSKIPGPIGDMWDKVQAGAEDASDSINKFREGLRDTEKTSNKVRFDYLFGGFDKVSASSRRGERVIDDYNRSLLRNLRRSGGEMDTYRDHFSGAMRGVGRNLDDGSSDISDYYRQLSRNLDRSGDKTGDFRRQSGGNFTGLSDVIGNALSVIGANTNQILGQLGAKKLQFSALQKAKIAKGDDARGLQQGGAIVPGTGTGDKVPLHLGGRLAAMVEPGELVSVANRNATAALMAHNEAVPRFAGGGLLGAHATVSNFVRSLMDKFGGGPTSGLRAGDSGSLHSTGQAIDYVPGDWGAAAAAVNRSGASLLEGIYNPASFGGPAVSWDSGANVPSSFWGASTWAGHMDHIHIAIADGAKVAAAAAVKKIKRLILEGPDGPLKDIGQASIDKATKAANAYIAKHAPTVGPESGVGYVSGGDNAVAVQIGNILTRQGFDRAAAAGIIGNAYRESLWNPASVGSGGGGLWGFTTSPVSLADLQAFASNQGRPWTDVGLQTQFMLQHGGMDLQGVLNALTSPEQTAAMFMTAWERPGVPALAERQAAARRAYEMKGWQKGGIVAKLAKGGLLPPSVMKAASGGPSTIPGAYPLPGGGPNDYVTGGPPVANLAESIWTLLGSTARDKAAGQSTQYDRGVKRIKDNIDALGLKPGMLDSLKSKSGDIARFAENADAASSLGLPVGGKSQIEWLQEQLEAQFEYRWMLVKVETAARGRAKEVAKFVRKLEHEIERMKKVVDRNEDREKEFKEAVSKAKGKEAKEAAEGRLKTFQAMLGGQRAKLGLLNGMILPGANRELTSLRNHLDVENSEGAAGILQSLQGIGVTKKKLRFTEPFGAELGLLKGDILSTQLSLRDALAESTDDGGRHEALDEIARQLTAATARENALLRAQMPVFQSMVPYMGAFASGGVALVGETGPELASLPSGTRITSASETRSMVAPEVSLILNDCTIDTHGQTLEEAVQVEVNGQLQEAVRIANRRAPSTV